ncbi:MAG: hypothetical protein K8S27_15570 [Candidatus Omnitrophica bacterium]|nr:hypothetical protein [Candidatus Omnitrophota bacterium]
MKSKVLFISIFSLGLFYLFIYNPATQGNSSPSVAQTIDVEAAKDGPVYGDPRGLQRVKMLERRLSQMRIREDHPRIYINKEMLSSLRKKIGRTNPYWQNILKSAEQGDMINAAFAYAILDDANPKSSELLLNIVKDKLLHRQPKVTKDWQYEKDVAVLALAFDWVYNGLSDEERRTIIDKIYRLSNLKEKGAKLKNGKNIISETFHREVWIFHSYRTWPEIALAHHVAEAQPYYLARWRYDWIWGDAARMYAYAADGSPFEGYYYGADGADWLYGLKTSTGVNLIDDERLGWARQAAYYLLYRLDLGTGREIFHKGVALGGGGIVSLKDGPVAWKIRAFYGRTFALAADDPHIKWLIENLAGMSSWVLTSTGYKGLNELNDITRFLFDSPFYDMKNPQYARYEDLPYARLFPGGREAVMRTSFRPQSTNVAFTARPAYTMTSHSDFDVNTFMIYKQGNLAPDSGVYDAYVGQKNYFKYQKNTGAHNDILVIDPARPDAPRKLSGNTSDPGGVERVFTRTFGALWKFGMDDVFLHNPKADWSKILDFQTTPAYDYIISDATKAYSSRVNEYIRSLVFIRKGDNAYIVIFDRVESKKDNFIKKWLLHLVSEPKLNGQIITTRTKGQHETYRSNFLVAANAYDTTKLYSKTLLPHHFVINKIGGSGYEGWVEGSKPKNYPVSQKTKERIEAQMQGKWEETGTWRIEVISREKQKRDYFLHVLYAAGISEKLDPENIQMEESSEEVKVVIQDEVLGSVTVTLPKTQNPFVRVDVRAQP